MLAHKLAQVNLHAKQLSRGHSRPDQASNKGCVTALRDLPCCTVVHISNIQGPFSNCREVWEDLSRLASSYLFPRAAPLGLLHKQLSMQFAWFLGASGRSPLIHESLVPSSFATPRWWKTPFGAA